MRGLQKCTCHCFVHADPTNNEESHNISQTGDDQNAPLPPMRSDASYGSTSTVDIPVADDYRLEDGANVWATGVQHNEPHPIPTVKIHRTFSESTVAATTSATHTQSWPHLDPKASMRSTFTGRSGVSWVERKPTFFKGLFHVHDNKIALKLFGSKNGIYKEDERLKQCGYCVIHPCSKFRIYWDLLMMIVLFLNVILLPVSIAFVKETLNPGWLVFDCFSDTIFILDIILNFWTGIVTDDNTVILDLKIARTLYAKSWLIVDLISVFPFDYISLAVFKAVLLTTVTSRALRLFRLLKLLSLLRLFRVFRFMYYLAMWEELFNATKSLARIGNFILAMLILAHWNGCIQFLVPSIQGFPRNSWVAINHLQNATVGTQYSWALFKSISHMLCIGFGRWPPQNTTEVWITIISMMVGASLYAMFIGHISTLIHSSDYSSRHYNETLKQVEEYMRYRKLPGKLKRRVHEYYYQRYHGQLFSEERIIKDLSQTLREDIITFNCQGLVRVVPFFANANQAFITSVVTRLTFDVFLPCDYIVRCGAIGQQMYFIQHGVVDVITADKKVATSLCDGSYFGEISLLMKCQRTASVRAVTVCSIYCLAKDDFQLVLNEYPHMKDIMEKEARERLAMIQENFPSSAQHHSDSEPGPSGNTGYTHLMHPRPSTLTVKEEENCSDPGAIV